MKKTLLAVSIATLFAAGSASAAEVYNQDGVSLNLFGDIEVQLVSDMVGKDTKKAGKPDVHHEVNSGYLHLDDADFGFKLAYEINETINIGGVVEFSGEGGTADLGDAYVGMMFNKVTVTAGKQTTILDDAGVGKDYKFGFNTVVSDYGFSGKQVIKVKADYGMVYGGVAYQLNGDKGFKDGNENLVDNDTSGIDAKLGLRVAGLDAAIFYGQNDKKTLNVNKARIEKKESSTLIGQATYNFESFNINGFVSKAETKTDGATTSDMTAYGLSGQYLVNDWDFAIGAGQVADNQNSKKDFYKSYVNAGYAFASNVHTFAEVGLSDATYFDSKGKEQDAEVGFAAGIKVNF